MPENAGSMQTKILRKGQFKPGHSGNPEGKKSGTLNHSTRTAQILLDGQAEKLTEKCVELALNGDAKALRLAMERILPPRKTRTLTFDLPPLETPQDALNVSHLVFRAVAAGELTLDEAEHLKEMLAGWLKVYETVEIAQRMDRLEALLQEVRL